jgi:hypothetical protein
MRFVARYSANPVTREGAEMERIATAAADRLKVSAAEDASNTNA